MDTYDKARRDLIMIGKFTLKWGLAAIAAWAVVLLIGNMVMH